MSSDEAYSDAEGSNDGKPASNTKPNTAAAARAKQEDVDKALTLDVGSVHYNPKSVIREDFRTVSFQNFIDTVLPTAEQDREAADAAITKLVQDHLPVFIESKDAMDSLYETDQDVFDGEALDPTVSSIANITDRIREVMRPLFAVHREQLAVQSLSMAMHRMGTLLYVPAAVYHHCGYRTLPCTPPSHVLDSTFLRMHRLKSLTAAAIGSATTTTTAKQRKSLMEEEDAGQGALGVPWVDLSDDEDDYEEDNEDESDDSSSATSSDEEDDEEDEDNSTEDDSDEQRSSDKQQKHRHSKKGNADGGLDTRAGGALEMRRFEKRARRFLRPGEKLVLWANQSLALAKRPVGGEMAYAMLQEQQKRAAEAAAATATAAGGGGKDTNPKARAAHRRSIHSNWSEPDNGGHGVSLDVAMQSIRSAMTFLEEHLNFETGAPLDEDHNNEDNNPSNATPTSSHGKGFPSGASSGAVTPRRLSNAGAPLDMSRTLSDSGHGVLSSAPAPSQSAAAASLFLTQYVLALLHATMFLSHQAFEGLKQLAASDSVLLEQHLGLLMESSMAAVQLRHVLQKMISNRHSSGKMVEEEEEGDGPTEDEKSNGTEGSDHQQEDDDRSTTASSADGKSAGSRPSRQATSQKAKSVATRSTGGEEEDEGSSDGRSQAPSGTTVTNAIPSATDVAKGKGVSSQYHPVEAYLALLRDQLNRRQLRAAKEHGALARQVLARSGSLGQSDEDVASGGAAVLGGAAMDALAALLQGQGGAAVGGSSNNSSGNGSGGSLTDSFFVYRGSVTPSTSRAASPSLPLPNNKSAQGGFANSRDNNGATGMIPENVFLSTLRLSATDTASDLSSQQARSAGGAAPLNGGGPSAISQRILQSYRSESFGQVLQADLLVAAAKGHAVKLDQIDLHPIVAASVVQLVAHAHHLTDEGLRRSAGLSGRAQSFANNQAKGTAKNPQQQDTTDEFQTERSDAKYFVDTVLATLYCDLLCDAEAVQAALWGGVGRSIHSGAYDFVPQGAMQEMVASARENAKTPKSLLVSDPGWLPKLLFIPVAMRPVPSSSQSEDHMPPPPPGAPSNVDALREDTGSSIVPLRLLFLHTLTRMTDNVASLLQLLIDRFADHAVLHGLLRPCLLLMAEEPNTAASSSASTQELSGTAELVRAQRRRAQLQRAELFVSITTEVLFAQLEFFLLLAQKQALSWKRAVGEGVRPDQLPTDAHAQDLLDVLTNIETLQAKIAETVISSVGLVARLSTMLTCIVSQKLNELDLFEGSGLPVDRSRLLAPRFARESVSTAGPIRLFNLSLVVVDRLGDVVFRRRLDEVRNGVTLLFGQTSLLDELEAQAAQQTAAAAGEKRKGLNKKRLMRDKSQPRQAEKQAQADRASRDALVGLLADANGKAVAQLCQDHVQRLEALLASLFSVYVDGLHLACCLTSQELHTRNVPKAIVSSTTSRSNQADTLRNFRMTTYLADVLVSVGPLFSLLLESVFRPSLYLSSGSLLYPNAYLALAYGPNNSQFLPTTVSKSESSALQTYLEQCVRRFEETAGGPLLEQSFLAMDRMLQAITAVPLERITSFVERSGAVRPSFDWMHSPGACGQRVQLNESTKNLGDPSSLSLASGSRGLLGTGAATEGSATVMGSGLRIRPYLMQCLLELTSLHEALSQLRQPSIASSAVLACASHIARTMITSFHCNVCPMEFPEDGTPLFAVLGLTLLEAEAVFLLKVLQILDNATTEQQNKQEKDRKQREERVKKGVPLSAQDVTMQRMMLLETAKAAEAREMTAIAVELLQGLILRLSATSDAACQKISSDLKKQDSLQSESKAAPQSTSTYGADRLMSFWTTAQRQQARDAAVRVTLQDARMLLNALCAYSSQASTLAGGAAGPTTGGAQGRSKGGIADLFAQRTAHAADDATHRTGRFLRGAKLRHDDKEGATAGAKASKQAVAAIAEDSVQPPPPPSEKSKAKLKREATVAHAAAAAIGGGGGGSGAGTSDAVVGAAATKAKKTKKEPSVVEVPKSNAAGGGDTAAPHGRRFARKRT